LLSLLLSLSAFAQQGTWNFQSCTYQLGSQKWDFSSLISPTGYIFQQTIYPQMDQYLIVAAEPPAPVNYTFEVNVCRNVKSSSANCTVPSPVNMIDDQGNCTPLGDLRTASMDITPYKDGVFISYYHGGIVNHIQNYASRVYILCKQQQAPPFMEHLTDFYQWHIEFDTPYGCPL